LIKLYLDEDVPEAVAISLRLRGYDVSTTREANLKGLKDVDQLEYALFNGRVLITHNIADFIKIHKEFAKKGKKHNGIVLSKQLPIGQIVKGLLKLLSNLSPDKIRNNVIWLSDWLS
jgi:predicted nuclease of predicted toxin-antitoxin system